MKYFTLSNGTPIPRLGLGCGAIQREQVEGTLRTALNAGYRLFDCALLYGNEAWIGDAFETIFKEGKYSRSDVFITTKLPMIGNRPERVGKFLEKSLKNLKTSYVDMYLIHFPVGFSYINDETFFPKIGDNIELDYDYSDLVSLWHSMEEQVISGRTVGIGVSNFSSEQLARILNSCRIPPANLQIEVHAYFQQPDLRKFCKNNGIVVSAYAPLGSPGRKEAFKPKGVPDILHDPVVVEIALKHDKTPATVLLKFLTEEGVVPLPKSVSPERLIANINLFDFDLSTEEMETLKELDHGEDGRSFDYLKIFKGLGPTDWE